MRGYGYKKISPKNKDGKLVGGSRLVTGSLEYQYQVYPKWWKAEFAETGLAANSYTATDNKTIEAALIQPVKSRPDKLRNKDLQFTDSH